MSQSSNASKGKARFDPWSAAASLMFIAAVAAAAWLVFQSNPESASALLLLAGLAGVVFLALFAFGAAENRKPAVPDREVLVDALEEPACVAAPDGRLRRSRLRSGDATGVFKAQPEATPPQIPPGEELGPAK